MNPYSQDGPALPASGGSNQSSKADAPYPRPEVENSVFEALRPLFRPKRKEPRDEVHEPEQNSGGPSQPEAAAAEGPDTAHDGRPDLSENQVAAGPDSDPDSNPSPRGDAAMTFDQFDETKAPEQAEASQTGPGAEVIEDEIESFAAIGEDLERRSRKSATMVRLLEQHRQQLKTAEKERDEAYDKLARVVPVVQETALALREAMDGRKIDIDPGRMHKLFKMNGRALDELEKVSTILFADFLWLKSAWEQYARSVEDARRFRANLDS